MKLRNCFTALLLFALPITSFHTAAANPGGYSLSFDPTNYSVKTLTLGNQTITYRAYEKIVYVKNPIDTKYQVMNLYVPVEYYDGKTIGNYSAETAPIFLPISIKGYLPGIPEGPGQSRKGEHGSSSGSTALVALSKGYVVAIPGARGRITKDKGGLYTGKAPACIVDLKAAVRYLRYNDKLIPGDAEKIISNGTSAGGALSSLLGATGNNQDYEPYLKALGAADARDDIFAASCYCPITNLENADTAYEWMFNGINKFNGWAVGTMTPQQIKLSDKLKALFPIYINSLNLTVADLGQANGLLKNGTALTLDATGNGSFKSYVNSFVIAAAQKALKNGKNLSGLSWITIKNGTVTDINFERYVKYATRMKPTPAFDAVNLKSPENNLFGSATSNAQHFTPFSKAHSIAGGSLADPAVVKLLNPMNYIGAKETTSARYWRIRHGTLDRDSSLALPLILATKLANQGYNVDFALPWGQEHKGDYDLKELFAWLDKICNSR